MLKQARSLRWGLLFLCLGLLSACQSENGEHKRLVFAVATAPKSLHPTLASDAMSERVNALIYAPLVGLDQEQHIVPGLLKWQVITPRHYRFIWNGTPATFSDGQQPHMRDVLATLQSITQNPLSPHAATLSHIDSITIKAASQQLDIKLHHDDPRFVEKLHIGLAPARQLEQPEQLRKHPVGNGAFVFEQRYADEGLSLVRRSDGLRVRIEVVPDPTMRALKLMRGEAQLLQNDLPFELFEKLASSEELELRKAPGTTFSYLGFNLADPVTGNPVVRRAIAYAIDRQAIVKHLFRGQARLANTLLVPEHWAANRRLEAWRYDPERARAELATLGIGPDNPLEISYKTSTDPFRLRIAAVLQAQLADVGIALKISSYEWGTFFADIKAGRFQMYSLSWVGIRSPDIFRYIYHSESLPPGGANRGRYMDELADNWIEKAEASGNEEARIFWQKLQSRVHEKLVYVPLWYENNLLVSRGLKSAIPRYNGNFDFLTQVSWADETAANSED